MRHDDAGQRRGVGSRAASLLGDDAGVDYRAPVDYPVGGRSHQRTKKNARASAVMIAIGTVSNQAGLGHRKSVAVARF